MCVIHFFQLQRKMDIYQVLNNTHLAAVYYNNRKLNLFRFHVDVTLADVNHQLDQLNDLSQLLRCKKGDRY
jgi:hypothetical protein